MTVMRTSNSEYVNAKGVLSNLNLYAFQNFAKYFLDSLHPEDEASKTLATLQQEAIPFPSHSVFERIDNFFLIESYWLTVFYNENIFKKHPENIVFPNQLFEFFKLLSKIYPYNCQTASGLFFGTVNLGDFVLMTNIKQGNPQDYVSGLRQLFKDAKVPRGGDFGVGTIETYFQNIETNNSTTKILNHYLLSGIEGIAFDISSDIIKVLPFQNQNIISGGIGNYLSPLETVVTTKLINNYAVFKETDYPHIVQ